MSKIHIVIAGDLKYKDYVLQGMNYALKLNYPVIVYDLGGTGLGYKFEGRVTDEPNAKIPCKPRIILNALDKVDDNDFVVWLDSDALIYSRIDEIIGDYEIGVTIRAPKMTEHSLPLNAGVVFVKKNSKAIEFVKQWMSLSEAGVSDQPPLNQLCRVTNKDRNTIVERNGVRIKVWQCEIYNNFYKEGKKSGPKNAKIIHYKTKLRALYPMGVAP